MSHAAEALAGQEFAHDLPTTPFDPALAAGRAGKIKVATIGLCGCWGCTLSLLDLDERLLPLMRKITLLRSSITGLRPPFLPRALAASSPAIVRSRITSLSNSAMEANT